MNVSRNEKTAANLASVEHTTTAQGEHSHPQRAGWEEHREKDWTQSKTHPSGSGLRSRSSMWGTWHDGSPKGLSISTLTALLVPAYMDSPGLPAHCLRLPSVFWAGRAQVSPSQLYASSQGLPVGFPTYQVLPRFPGLPLRSDWIPLGP